MLTLSLISLLVGAVLGMRFRVLVLLPAIIAELLAILAVGISSAAGFYVIASAMVLATTCLQFGYLGGVAARNALAVAGGRLDPAHLVRQARLSALSR